MKKKFVASMFALALAAATIAPTVAHAEKKPGIQDGSVLWKTTGNTKTDFGLSLNYEDALKPTYSVQVPQSLQMQEDGTDVYVKVSNTKNLTENNKYVSVKVRDTWATNFPKKYRDDDHKYNLYCGYDFMKYKVEPKLSDSSYGPALTDFNQELLTFTEDATKYYRVTPLEDTATNSNPYWWGQINFTIGVENIK